MNQSALMTPEMQHELIEFAQALVRIKSLSGEEKRNHPVHCREDGRAWLR